MRTLILLLIACNVYGQVSEPITLHGANLSLSGVDVDSVYTLGNIESNWTLNADSLPKDLHIITTSTGTDITNLKIATSGEIRINYPDRDTIPVKMLVTSKGEMYCLDYARQISGYEIRAKELVGDPYFGGYYYMGHLSYLFDNYKELTGNYTVWISQRIKK